jgi:hypothetical protein
MCSRARRESANTSNPATSAFPEVGEESREHSHCGAFACAVWAQEAHDFTSLNFKVDSVHSGESTEAFREFSTLIIHFRA